MLLTLTADLSGITSLAPTDTPDAPYLYHFRITCTSCREPHPNAVPVSRHETVDLPNSRGEAHLVIKCRNCGRDGSLSFLSGPSPYDASPPTKSATGKNKTGNTTRQRVIEFDTRGIDVTGFEAQGDWEAVGIESGTKFDGVDLSEGEWYDYDEKAGEEVSGKDFVWEVRKNV